MLILFLAIVLSVVFSIFATQNTSLITLYFYNFSLPNVPVYIVILVSVIISFAASIIIQALKNISSGITISNQEKRIKTLKKELAEITKEHHKLELENAKFKSELGEPDDENSI